MSTFNPHSRKRPLSDLDNPDIWGPITSVSESSGWDDNLNVAKQSVAPQSPKRNRREPSGNNNGSGSEWDTPVGGSRQVHYEAGSRSLADRTAAPKEDQWAPIQRQSAASQSPKRTRREPSDNNARSASEWDTPVGGSRKVHYEAGSRPVADRTAAPKEDQWAPIQVQSGGGWDEPLNISSEVRDRRSSRESSRADDFERRPSRASSSSDRDRDRRTSRAKSPPRSSGRDKPFNSHNPPAEPSGSKSDVWAPITTAASGGWDEDLTLRPSSRNDAHTSNGISDRRRRDPSPARYDRPRDRAPDRSSNNVITNSNNNTNSDSSSRKDDWDRPLAVDPPRSSGRPAADMELAHERASVKQPKPDEWKPMTAAASSDWDAPLTVSTSGRSTNHSGSNGNAVQYKSFPGAQRDNGRPNGNQNEIHHTRRPPSDQLSSPNFDGRPSPRNPPESASCTPKPRPNASFKMETNNSVHGSLIYESTPQRSRAYGSSEQLPHCWRNSTEYKNHYMPILHQETNFRVEILFFEQVVGTWMRRRDNRTYVRFRAYKTEKRGLRSGFSSKRRSGEPELLIIEDDGVRIPAESFLGGDSAVWDTYLIKVALEPGSRDWIQGRLEAVNMDRVELSVNSDDHHSLFPPESEVKELSREIKFCISITRASNIYDKLLQIIKGLDAPSSPQYDPLLNGKQLPAPNITPEIEKLTQFLRGLNGKLWSAMGIKYEVDEDKYSTITTAADEQNVKRSNFFLTAPHLLQPRAGGFCRIFGGQAIAEEQWSAVKSILASRVTVVRGRARSGKTSTLVAAAVALINARPADSTLPVVIATETNANADLITRMLMGILGPQRVLRLHRRRLETDVAADLDSLKVRMMELEKNLVDAQDVLSVVDRLEKVRELQQSQYKYEELEQMKLAHDRKSEPLVVVSTISKLLFNAFQKTTMASFQTRFWCEALLVDDAELVYDPVCMSTVVSVRPKRMALFEGTQTWSYIFEHMEQKDVTDSLFMGQAGYQWISKDAHTKAYAVGIPIRSKEAIAAGLERSMAARLWETSSAFKVSLKNQYEEGYDWSKFLSDKEVHKYETREDDSDVE